MNIKSILGKALRIIGVAGFCTAANASQIEMTLPDLMATSFPIDSFSWGLHLSGGGPSTVSDFTFTRPVDMTSTALAHAALEGTRFPTGTVDVCYGSVKFGSPCGKPGKELLITFTDAMIESYTISGLTQNPKEEFTLAFERVTLQYSGAGSTNDNLKQKHPWTVLIPQDAPSGAGAPPDLTFAETPDALDLLASDQTVPGALGLSLPDTLAGTISAPVPVPAAGWLLLSTLGGLGVVGRKRRSKPAFRTETEIDEGPSSRLQRLP